MKYTICTYTVYNYNIPKFFLVVQIVIRVMQKYGNPWDCNKMLTSCRFILVLTQLCLCHFDLLTSLIGDNL